MVDQPFDTQGIKERFAHLVGECEKRKMQLPLLVTGVASDHSVVVMSFAKTHVQLKAIHLASHGAQEDVLIHFFVVDSEGNTLTAYFDPESRIVVVH
jgi:hypothetical protein